MAITGQRFELDLDADNFKFDTLDEPSIGETFRIKDVLEHDSSDAPPPPPAPKVTRHGFPEHKQRNTVSRFKQSQQKNNSQPQTNLLRRSDAALAHAVGKRKDLDVTRSQKDEISRDNDRRIATMSEAEVEDARAEILATLSPALVERLMKRSRIDDSPDNDEFDARAETTSVLDDAKQARDNSPEGPSEDVETDNENPTSTAIPTESPNSSPTPPQPTSSVHFPHPPRAPSDFRPLDPSSATFLSDLKSVYFPELVDKPSPESLSWLQPQSPQDLEASSYSPALSSYPASSIRFSFRGELIPPNESLNLPGNLGLHHHGEAPDSAGYTITELTLLTRSALPNQRALAYQTVGRILFRLGKEEFGQRGSELYEALWALVEKERVLEVIMAEASRDKGHASAKAHATEALWLWRKSCGGERGLLKQGEKIAK